MAGLLEQPECSERSSDRAHSVHQSFEAERAAVGARESICREQRFSDGRANAAAEPGRRAANQNLVGVSGKRKRSGRQRGDGIPENGQRLAMLEPVGEMAGSKL